jgi:hypothetical protein
MGSAERGRRGRLRCRISVPRDVEETLDGFIEDPVELVDLLKICRDAREGRPLSPAVLMAAHLMTK